jgi:flagellar basal body rod protein FlgG
MADGIYAALSGALATSRQVENLSHNVANQNTSGYRQFRVAFEEAKGDTASMELGFASTTSAVIDVRSGEIRETGSPMDVALEEGVYLGVLEGDRRAATRGGTLVVRPDGQLVDAFGRVVLGADGPARVPPGSREVSIEPGGELMADGAVVDRLRLLEYRDEGALRPGSGGALVSTVNEEGTPTARRSPLMTGYVEDSNFDVLKGITDLITAQRGYEATIKAVETFSHVNKRAARDLAARM